MRQLIAGFSVVVSAWGCGTGSLPLSPSTGSSLLTSSRAAVVDSGNWTPWLFNPWQPGVGHTLTLGTTVDAIVDADDECVPDLRSTWDTRVSCKRFTVSVPAAGRLDVFLRWDASAEGFDPLLSGEVVLLAPSGRFTLSDWQHIEERVFALVEPGEYGVLVMSYAPANLPFQIRTAFEPR